MAVIEIIEDEAVLGRNVARALQADGHSVHLSATGVEGLERAQSDQPDLVLLDLRLPDLPGLDVLEGIQSRGQAPPVLIMTAYASVPDAVRAMRAGACDYLEKPIDLEELKLLVQRWAARWTMLSSRL